MAGTRRAAPDRRRSRAQHGAHNGYHLDLAVAQSKSGCAALSHRVGDRGSSRDHPQCSRSFGSSQATAQRSGYDDRRTPDDGGAALIVLGVVHLRGSRSQRTGLPRWLSTVDSFGALVSFAVAVVLDFRPKGLLLGVAAGLALHAASVKAGEAAVLIAIYTVIATSTVVIPIAASFMAPRRMEPKLIAARDWMAHNGGTLTSLMMLMIGVVILGAGLTHL